MKRDRVWSILLACVMVMSCTITNAQRANAAEIDMPTVFASGKFSMTVPANSTSKADAAFPLEAGETVRINASYSPDGSVDFGLLDSDGVFHFLNVTDGSINKTIKINTRGSYTLSIRNNTDHSIDVSGYVTY